jgi:hypothetical protein
MLMSTPPDGVMKFQSLHRAAVYQPGAFRRRFTALAAASPEAAESLAFGSNGVSEDKRGLLASRVVAGFVML